MAFGDQALVAGTEQNLSNLLFFRYLWKNHRRSTFYIFKAEMPINLLEKMTYCFCFSHLILLSCEIFEHFALQVDPVIEFIQLGSTPFKDSAILAPKLADPPFWWKSNSTPSKSGSSLPDLYQLIFCPI